LKYKPSIVAACSVILAINIYENEMNLEKDKLNFFENCNFKDNKGELNLEIWNNSTVHNLTKISIIDI